MSNPNDQGAFTRPRPKLALDRENRKLLGVCAGFARYLEVPAALVRVIYLIACLVSPILLIAYFLLYWLIEDEERPARLKAAISRKRDDTESVMREAEREAGYRPANDSVESEPAEEAPGTGRFNLKRPFYRSRRNVRIAGVCAGVADYLGISTFLVRLITFLSLFIVGGLTLWAYVILWIVLDKEPKVSKKGTQGTQRTQDRGAEAARHKASVDDCVNNLRATEQRLQEVEAFITSKQFRLHCEINRI